MKKIHKNVMACSIFLGALIADNKLWASVAPEERIHSSDPITTYYERCHTTYGTQMPTRAQKYGTAVPYHLYDSLVLHMHDYKIKKDMHGISRSELDNESLYLRGHIQHILTSHPCIAHIQALLVQCGLDDEFEFIPEPRH